MYDEDDSGGRWERELEGNGALLVAQGFSDNGEGTDRVLLAHGEGSSSNPLHFRSAEEDASFSCISPPAAADGGPENPPGSWKAGTLISFRAPSYAPCTAVKAADALVET